MAQVLYVNPDPSTQDRATTLGCGWMPSIPPQYAGIATAPCVIVSGQGTTTVLTEPTTPGAVASALAPILSAEQAAAATAATQAANRDALAAKAQQALTTNATFQAIASPSNAQIAAQVQSLTKQANGIIRLLLNALDSTTGT